MAAWLRAWLRNWRRMALQLPASARACLPAELNAMQRACEPVALQQDASFVLSAPTGCGKSVVCALAMLREWRRYVAARRAFRTC